MAHNAEDEASYWHPAIVPSGYATTPCPRLENYEEYDAHHVSPYISYWYAPRFHELVVADDEFYR